MIFIKIDKIINYEYEFQLNDILTCVDGISLNFDSESTALTIKICVYIRWNKSSAIIY